MAKAGGFAEIDPLAARAGEDPTAGRLTAPMPGRVTQLMVEPGTSVRRGEPLMIIEAMKMEHTVTAPADGIVEAVRFAAGELVEEGAELIALVAARPGTRLIQLHRRDAAAPSEAGGRASTISTICAASGQLGRRSAAATGSIRETIRAARRRF